MWTHEEELSYLCSSQLAFFPNVSCLSKFTPSENCAKNRKKVQKCLLKCQELICAHSISWESLSLWSSLWHLVAAVSNTWAEVQHAKGMQDPTLSRCHNNKNAVHKHLHFCVSSWTTWVLINIVWKVLCLQIRTAENKSLKLSTREMTDKSFSKFCRDYMNFF